MTHDKPHILVVDDDDRLRGLLSKYLSDQGFIVTAAESAAEARSKLTAFVFDLLILDVMMPNETGLEFLASLKGQHIPTLMLSAMGEAEDRIIGLELGAEDYLVKPFEPKELVLRIRAILRRVSVLEEKSQIVQFGEFRFDILSLQLKRGEELVYLTSNEAFMLKLLAQQAGNPVSREELAKLMPSSGSERSIDVQMVRLRKKIEENDSKPQNIKLYLQTIRGAGYVLYAQKAGNI
ncbi:MAG: response regulator [Rickettsiales bacterium]|jgi:two-component system phosphate regulon response regulator OmpR